MNLLYSLIQIINTIMLFNKLGALTIINTNLQYGVLYNNLGKTFEKAICLLYDTPYNGNPTQYDLSKAEELMVRTSKLKQIYPSVKHVISYASKYDFVLGNSDESFLSAKTTKYRGKVCPQVIGQCTRKMFCEYFNILDGSIQTIKWFIEKNISIVLGEYIENTFLCPILYYNENTDKLSIIKKRQPILWDNYTFEFSHLNKNKEWGGSTTLYLIDEIRDKNISIGEFQTHKGRDIMKFRWYFENLLGIFPEKFEITYL